MSPDVLLAAGMAVLQVAGMLALAPLLKSTIKKAKAVLQTRQGPPLLQGYYDLAKLLRKEPVRSQTASWVYVAGPRMYFAAAVAATTLVPVLVAAAPFEAAGGILLLVGTLGSTIGHRLVGLRVLSLHGGAARPLQVLVRTVLLCLFLPAMFWDRDGRGLHDKAAGTVIVRT